MAPVQRLPMSSIARWNREQTCWVVWDDGLSDMTQMLKRPPLDTSYLLKYTSIHIVSPPMFNAASAGSTLLQAQIGEKNEGITRDCHRSRNQDRVQTRSYAHDRRVLGEAPHELDRE